MVYTIFCTRDRLVCPSVCVYNREEEERGSRRVKGKGPTCLSKIHLSFRQPQLGVLPSLGTLFSEAPLKKVTSRTIPVSGSNRSMPEPRPPLSAFFRDVSERRLPDPSTPWQPALVSRTENQRREPLGLRAFFLSLVLLQLRRCVAISNCLSDSNRKEINSRARWSRRLFVSWEKDISLSLSLPRGNRHHQVSIWFS